MSYMTYAKSSECLFNRAMRRGVWQRLLRRLQRQPVELIPFDHARQSIEFGQQCERGIRPIPVRDIVGSLGRVNEFDRDFMPIKPCVENKWRRILRLKSTGIDLPPIEVYKLNGGYYVIDGNHRVSVSRFLGMDYIDAHVIEIACK